MHAGDASPTDSPPTLGRRNVVAGIAGYGWTSMLQLVATPILLSLLGPESFGLVGFYMAAQGVAQIFDLGLSPTINREMARASVGTRAEEAHDFLRTVERGYWIVGIVLGALVMLLAPMLASHWVDASRLPAAAIRRDVALIGLLIAIQWPITLYEGGLTGLQRIVTLHMVGIAFRTLGVAAGLILVYVARDLSVYLLALCAASVLHVIVLAVALRRSLPLSGRPGRWDPATVYGVWRFAGGMSVLLLLSAVLVHADKLVLSRLLSLRAFGYYTLATLMSSGLYVLIMPVFYALFPALSTRVAAGDAAGERALYHLGAQTLAVLVIPAGAVIALFAPDIITVWTRSTDTALQAAPIARLLVLGTALNGLMSAPYALQLAHGRTRIGITVHLLLIALYLPAIAAAAVMYGPRGAAVVWIGLNVIYLVTAVPMTHREMLCGEAMRWLAADVLAPSAAGLLVAALGWFIVRHATTTPVVAVAGALATLAAAWLAAAMAAGQVRHWILPATRAMGRAAAHP